MSFTIKRNPHNMERLWCWCLPQWHVLGPADNGGLKVVVIHRLAREDERDA